MSDSFDRPPPPWKKKAPAKKNSKPTKLTPESVRKAKARAEEHGRKYPNLVDNMWAAQMQKKASQK